MTITDLLINGNIEEMSNFIRMKELMELPPLVKFSDNKGYSKLERIKKNSKDNNVLIKTLRELKSFVDYEKEEVHSGKMIKLLSCFQEQTPKILKILRKYISEIHQLKEVMPLFRDVDKDTLIKCFDYISKYNQETFLDILPYIHHKKVIDLILNKESKKKILFEIEKIKKSNFKRNETLTYKKEYGPGYKMFLKAKRKHEKLIFTYAPDMMFGELGFTKDPVVASFWGEETKCCLKKGGAAGALLEIIERCPIAGEIVGKIGGTKISSYTWDMVECMNGKAYKTLVLDNIESPTILNEKNTEYLFDRLSSYGKYKSIYLGTIRNDCTIDTDKYQIKNRQSLIPGFDSVYNKSVFTKADSKQLYIMREHDEDRNLEYRKMNISDLYLCKYVENYVYGRNIYDENDKTDILKQVTLETPCYIIDSKTNIYGYMLTKWKYFNEYNEEVFDNTGKKKFYIEDLVVSSDRKALLELKNIFDDLKKWLIDNKIKEVYINTNYNSKNFKKRLSAIGINVIEEKLHSIIPKNYLI